MKPTQQQNQSTHSILPLCFKLLFVLILLFPTACKATPTPASSAVSIKIAGSTSMKPLLDRLTTTYAEQHPHISFDIQSGGSRLGQSLVETKQVDIGMVSLAPSNLKQEFHLTAIARDAIAVIVHPQNQAIELSQQELRDIFSGRLLNWQGLDGAPQSIQVVSREDGSGTRMVFENRVMDGQPVTPSAIVLPSSRAVVDYVAQHPNTIGYVSLTFVDDTVYPVPIEGIAPTPAGLKTSRYFLTRDLSLVTQAPAPPEVDQFLEFIFSPAGQIIIEKSWDTTLSR